MVKIDIDKNTLLQLLEYHSNYVINTIPNNWKTIVGKTLNNQKITQAELDYIDKALQNHVLKTFNAKLGSSIRFNVSSASLLSQYVVLLCTTQDLANYAIHAASLFPQNTERYTNILLKIMGYSDFNKGDTTGIYNKGKIWNRHTFIQELHVKVCPYCNRQYITSFHKNNHQVTTADIDHYYPKSQYPLLSMNFFNMVPSCSICNSRLKGKKRINQIEIHLNPFFDDTDSLIFAVNNDSLEALYNFSNSEVKISVDINRTKNKSNQKRAENSKKMFYLPALYNTHIKEVKKIRENINRFSKEYFNNTFNKNYSGLFDNYEELKQAVFHFNYISAGDEPLTKLKRDVYNQLSIHAQK